MFMRKHKSKDDDECLDSIMLCSYRNVGRKHCRSSCFVCSCEVGTLECSVRVQVGK